MKTKKTYYKLLQDPKWQKKRLEILNRDEFMCQYCGDKDSTLHVHHKSYIYGNAIWDYPESNLITFCESCHDKVTETKKAIKSIIDEDLTMSDELGELLIIVNLLKRKNPYELFLIGKIINNL